MKTFEQFDFDYPRCRTEVSEYERLLAIHSSLDERKDILPFFRKNRQLAALCGVLSSRLNTEQVDRIAWEYDLFGDFACDLVIGDSRRGAFCFIEFENAAPQSIFEKAGKATRDWAI